MDKIRGYKITGEVAGSSARLYLAKRWGKRYVLKEFRHYRFPVEESEACPPMLSHVEQRTQAFYDRLQHQAQYVRKHVREDGLLNVPLEVFRQGKMIYKVTRQIDDCGIGTSELHEKLTPRQMAVLLRSILLQLQSLHQPPNKNREWSMWSYSRHTSHLSELLQKNLYRWSFPRYIPIPMQPPRQQRMLS